jgi:hypothetical protein
MPVLSQQWSFVNVRSLICFLLDIGLPGAKIQGEVVAMYVVNAMTFQDVIGA